MNEIIINMNVTANQEASLKPTPIHLGELLNEDLKPVKEISHKVVINYNDHREILYPKAALSELQGPEADKRIAEDKRRREAAQMHKEHLEGLFKNEAENSRINKMKLLSDWRVIMRIAKIDKIKQHLKNYMEIFGRDLDDKDAILQNLDRDIMEAEEHFNIALTNHFIHIKQLISLQDSRVKGLFREFEKDVSELENEFKTEFEEIRKQYEEEQNEILRMLNNITETYNKKINKLKQEFQELQNSQIQKINEIYSHIQEAIKKSATDINNKFSNEMNDIKQKSEDKNNQEKKGSLKLAKLEKEVLAKKKKVERQNDELKRLRLKIKQNNEDWDLKNNSLKKEKEKIMMSYRILKSKLIEFRNNQREKLKRLVKNSWDCGTKLKSYIQLSEKILKLAEISRRLEIDREKILPYYENSDLEKDENAQVKLTPILGVDPILYEEIESLQNFWKRYNKVKLDVIAIKKQKGEVEKKNELLKNCLQQYYDGFHVNNVVMTNENPLLMIDKVNMIVPVNVIEERENLQPLQEGNFIVADTKKQKCFNIVCSR